MNPTTPDTAGKPAKPEKPSPDFPLFAHANGRWAKKIGGRLFYFGRWDNPAAALALWEKEKKDLLAGRIPQRQKPARTRPADAPPSPHPDLFPHASRQWAKKIRGKLYYFGSWDTPEAARERYLAERDDLMAGRTPRASGDGLTVRDLVNRFLAAKQASLDAGEIRQRTWDEYAETTKRLVDGFGASRLVEDLAADDFEALRKQIAQTWGPVRLGNEVQRVRTVFKYGYEAGLIIQPTRFGPSFVKPSRKVMRLARAERAQRFFTPEVIRALLAEAKPQLRAMIYLGINCGWGNADMGNLERRHLDLKRGIATYARGKTGIERRATLWPETVKALKDALAVRPTPKLEADADCVFVTKYGYRWTGDKVGTDAVGLEFGKLMRATKVQNGRKKTAVKTKGDGLNFYTLRHTFETVAGETRDQAAVDRIMGHVDDSMAATYREWCADAREDARLKAVTDHVRAWLQPEPAK